MPNEFIARNGVISRGNLIVSGSLVTTQPTTFSGSLSLTGDLNFQPGATRYISMSASPTTASGNSIIIQAGDATASGTGGSVSIQPGGGAGGPGGGTVILSNTTWWNGATVNGLLTVTNQGPNTGTALTVNAGGGIAMKWDWDNINLVNTVSSATNKILRFTGATQYQVRGSGTTFSTTAFQVQNANASASLSVRDDGLVTVGGNIALPVSSYVYWGDANSSVQHTGAAMNFRVYQSGFGWNFIHADTSTTQASINTGFVRAKTGFSSTGNSPVTMSGWDGGGGTAGNTLLVKGGNSGVGAVYTGGNAGDLILENGLATDNSSGNGGTPGSIVFKYGTYNNTASVEYGRLNSSGNFLIGTTAGSAKLLISGSASSTLLKIDSTASSSILVVSGSGRVGIATSTPSATFTVGNTDTVFGSNVGYGAIYGTGSDGIVQIKTDGSSTEMWFRPNNSPSSYNGSYWSKIVQANYSFSIYSGNYQSLTLATGNYPGNGGSIILTGAAGAGTDAITINGPTNAGRVAITTYQSSPITLNGGNVLVGTTTGSAKLTVKGTGATSSSTGLLVQNANLSSSLAVLDNGYVGIGTSSPSTQLEVYSGSAGGTIKVSNSTYSSYWTQGSGFNTTLALSAQGNITWGNGAIFRFYSTGDTTDYRLDSGTFYTNNSQARFYAGHQGYLGFQTIGSSTAYDAIGAVFTDNNTVSLRFFYKNTGSDIEGMRLTSAGLVGIGTTSPSAKLTVQGTGTSSSTTALLVQNSSGTNILTVQDSGQVGIGTTALTGSLDVVGGALVVKTFGSTARGLHLYSNQNTPWRITNNSNTFAIYAPRADTNAAVELINLSDYVDASVPILSFKGGMSGMGYPHYWGINANQTSSYTSDFVVKGTLANTYAIGVATTADKLTAGITPAGGAYFSGSVGIGTNSPAYTLDVSGSTRLNGTGLTTGQHTVATLGFTGGGSTITSIGNAYINFYTRGFRGFDLYNGSSAADTQKVLIGNFVTYGVETARYSAAMLIVESETRGFLPPRTGFTSNISSPGQGLITYVTASTTEGLYYYNSGSYQAWTRVLNDSGSQNIAGNLTVTGSITATGGLTASSAIINGNLTVIGTASFTYTTASVVNIGGNLINLNTDNPAARFGGLTVTDSGSFGTSSTGSLLWDSQNNRWIYSNPSGSSYDGGLLISGPRNTSGLGSEEGTTLNALMKGQGGDHITSSGVFEVSGNVGIGTTTPAAKLDVNGTFKVSNTSTFDSQATFNNANIVATGINSQVGNFVISRANSNTSVEILGGTTSVKLDADNGSASTMFRGVTSIASSYITASAMLHVKGTGTSSSTTALLVQNANTSASLQVYDSGYVVVRQNYGINLAGSVNLWDNIQSVENGALILSPYWGVKINGTYPGGSDQANIPLLHVTRSLSAPLSPLVKFEESGSIRFIINNSGSVGIGTSSPAYTLDTQGSGRFTSGLTTTGSMFMTGSAVRFISNCSVLGGFNHTASGTFSVVAGGQTNKATGTTSGVLSGFCNTVTGQYSTLSGGYYNTVSGNYGGIVSGFLNSTGANKYNIIGGGSANCVTAGGILYGANNTVSAYWSGIVAGCCNTVSQTVSFIGSGRANGVSGACSGVVAGCTNTVSNNNSIIGAGVSNTVSGPCAAILGGESNTAARCYTAVLSGKQNTVSGNYSAFSVIVGGTGSVINGANNTILNGSYNTISAYINSSVIGGVCNTIFNNASLSGILSGDQSLISGSRGFIGSGNANRICATNGAIVNGQSNTLSIGSYSTISNGYQNSITANYGFIGAGRGNSVTAACSSIVGGCANTVSGGYSNIGGGKGNTVSGVISGIFSGQGNVVGNVGGAILYGINNRVCNQASYGGSVIVGGTDNLTLSNSYFSFVGAGKSNTSSGFYNALVAGRSNILSGAYGILGAGQNNVHNSCQGALMAGANNCLTGNNGFIGAGTLNTGSGCFSFTGAGQRNINAAQYGFIGSGIQNYISGIGSVIAGGGGNGQRGNAWDFANCCTYPGNCPSGDYSFVGGGVQNWAGSCLSTVVGGLYNTICSGYTGSFIGGGTCNSICIGDNSVIGGGAAHCLCATRAFLAGGYLNVHKGSQGFMGTGQQNTISGGGQNFLGSGVYNTVSNSYAVIVGGHSGTASGLWASIVGGLCNTASGIKTFIGSGECNTVTGAMSAVIAGSGSVASGACSFVGGGCKNTASGVLSFVGSGLQNSATSAWAVVAGGAYNTACGGNTFIGGGLSNTVSGNYSTLVGGQSNTVSGLRSSMGGGLANSATGQYTTIAGGCGNTTSGNYSGILGGGGNIVTATRSFIVGSNLTASMACYTYMNNAVITGSTSIGTTTTGSGLTVYKSGSSVLDIQGSQGQLFSVVDALSGSLMSVNDISGLPILEVFSDDRVVMGTYGNAALIVTGSDTQISASLFGTRQTGSLATGSTLLYTVNTGSYQAGFFDYYVSSGSNFRAGNIMAVFGAGTYKFTDLATPDIGSTTNLQFSMSMAGASAQLYASASSAGWTVKTTFRTI